MARIPGSSSVSGDDLVAQVRQYLGDPYVYGGAGPTSFDCSGLVQYALLQLGVQDVPRTSEDQWSWTDKISAADLRPGDLVFSQWPGDDAPPGHVAIYAGDNQIIEAPRPGESVHTIPLSSGYLQYVTGYGRVPGIAPSSTTGGGTVPTGQVSQADLTSALGGWLGGFLTTAEPSPITGLAGVLGTVGTPIANTLTDFDHALQNAMHGLLWLVNPMNWVRIIAGIVGGAAAITGAILLYQAA
jgi:hypothetical protein